MVSELYGMLEDGLTKALTEIQDDYAHPTEEHQITIVDNKMLKGLRSRNFSIKENQRKISQEILKELYSFVQSNEGLSLSTSFGINIKVLSLAEMRHNINKKTLEPYLVGCFGPNHLVGSTKFLQTYTFGNEQLKHKCLPVSLILGNIWNSFQNTDCDRAFKKNCAHLFLQPSKQKEGRNLVRIEATLISEIQWLAKEVPFYRGDGPFDLI